VAQDWEGISSEAQVGAVLMKGGKCNCGSLYLLDATSLGAPADTQFFCSNASGSVTVTLTMRALPPGRMPWCWPMRPERLRRPVGLHPGLGRSRRRMEAGGLTCARRT